MKYLVTGFFISCFFVSAIAVAQDADTNTAAAPLSDNERIARIEAREASRIEMEKELRKAEKRARALEKDRKKAEKTAKRQERHMDAMADLEKSVSRNKEKALRMEAKMEKDLARGKLSPNDIEKINGRLQDIRGKIARDEAKLRKLVSKY